MGLYVRSDLPRSSCFDSHASIVLGFQNSEYILCSVLGIQPGMPRFAVPPRGTRAQVRHQVEIRTLASCSGLDRCIANELVRPRSAIVGASPCPYPRVTRITWSVSVNVFSAASIPWRPRMACSTGSPCHDGRTERPRCSMHGLRKDIPIASQPEGVVHTRWSPYLLPPSRCSCCLACLTCSI